MGRKCGVDTCPSDSSRAEDAGVTFHKVPMHPDIRPKWLALCKIPDDKKDIKVIYICSRHFLRADFCNFKGKKYMLRQGVLPSVFPWMKIKQEETEVPLDESTLSGAIEPAESVKEEIGVKEEIKDDEMSKSEKQPTQSTTIEQKVKTVQTSYGVLNFAMNARIEALDFNNMWFPARIVEIDYEENEVLIHFEKYSSKYDEWICMNSARLRPLQPVPKKSLQKTTYAVGERCMASWNDARKFPATISKVFENDTYEVIFDDGFIKVLKSGRLSKQLTMQSSPLFDPVRGTKQDRRDKKRKLNVAALFGGKKGRTEGHEDVKSPQRRPEVEELQAWMPRWENDRPLGLESTIETNDGTRKSVIVADPRLPNGWVKHLTQRLHGASAGKWDTIIVSPEGRRFRTRTEIRTYLDDNPSLNYSTTMFDFGLYRRFSRKTMNKISATEQPPNPPLEPQPEPIASSSTEEEENANSLKIPVIDGGYQCPIEGCGKIFRKENLAQMHVKHYHPEYTKFLDFTPNVADLAYARTVGEALDRSPGPAKPTAVRAAPKTPKVNSPIAEDTGKQQQPPPPKTKDSEIIKLLNSKPFDSIKKEEPVAPLPSGLPPNMYPDIKLKDLLIKSEGVPKREDLNLKALSASTTRPAGIKTLLPVVRDGKTKGESPKAHATPKSGGSRQNVKRKRVAPETPEVKHETTVEQQPQQSVVPVAATEAVQQEQPVVASAPGNVIIEGGEVIKIVQMKREEIINCTCGITEEDGLMIQCELCLCWQHAYCNNIERESQVPEKYVCYICQNPVRQRVSKKYFHDQDWLKLGCLPTASYHCKDEDLLAKRFEKLKKSHDVSGGLLELKDYVHTLKVKIKIAETKNHPKLYQWSKPWEKLPLPEKIDEDTETKPEQQQQNDSMLFAILKSGKEVQKAKEEFEGFPKLDINTIIDQMPGPPQPEAAIDSAVCKVNLIDHIAHSQSLVEERLDDFESQLDELDLYSRNEETDEDFPKMRQTLEMLLRDLSNLKQLSQVNSL